MITPPRRIAIVGNSGSGKSRLAAQIGKATGLPVHHLDQHFWLPGWVQRPRDDFDGRHERLVADDAWVIDGNFARTLPVRADRADAVIFFDMPVWLCLLRVAKRVATGLGRERHDMAPGCPERIDLAFVAYVWAWRTRRRDETLRALDGARAQDKVLVVKRRRDLAAVWQTLDVIPTPLS